jgi:hypothetical protein
MSVFYWKLPRRLKLSIKQFTELCCSFVGAFLSATDILSDVPCVGSLGACRRRVNMVGALHW